MDHDQQFDALKQILKDTPGTEEQRNAVLAGVLIIERVLKSLERSANALECIANSVEGIEQNPA